MKLPRDLDGSDLIQRLQDLGYEPTRQTGSHVRLTRKCGADTCHTTIPRHRALKVGTLNNILREVSTQLDMEKDELVRRLFLR